MDKRISIVTPCYNEVANVGELYGRICKVMEESVYGFEIIFIDNASTDGTADAIKALIAKDSRVRLIVNTRNFGHIRSPYYGVLQAHGDAVIYLASDLQDPPEMLPEFIGRWEKGAKVVLASKPVSNTNKIVHWVRKAYYRVVDGIAEVPIVKDTTGFGLYDQRVIEIIREINDPYPYFRGLVCELGFETEVIPFEQPRRLRGVSKNNLYTLFDMAMLGLVSHSKVPLRLATLFGFLLAGCSFMAAIGFFFYKLAHWQTVPLGLAPFAIIVLMLFGVLFVFVGILGEYIGSIYTHVQNRPVVVERERVNF
ncbi:MAG: glycosyltransferase family 2 protein [Gammaproteobacteria bacterium]